MPKYVTDYLQDFRTLGAAGLGRELTHPVLVLSGVTGTLRDERSGSGRVATTTAVIELNDTIALTRLVGRVFPIVKSEDAPPGPIGVGRSSENDVAIPDYSISNRHCYFMLNGRDIQLVDCGSTNGTLVGGRPVGSGTPLTLQGGETIVLGRFAFLFMRPTGFLEYLGKLSE
jgi:pSer/pThr/pTyr-binding forkhead associated (FHA) protein